MANNVDALMSQIKNSALDSVGEYVDGIIFSAKDYLVYEMSVIMAELLSGHSSLFRGWTKTPEERSFLRGNYQVGLSSDGDMMSGSTKSIYVELPNGTTDCLENICQFAIDNMKQVKF